MQAIYIFGYNKFINFGFNKKLETLFIIIIFPKLTQICINKMLKVQAIINKLPSNELSRL